MTGVDEDRQLRTAFRAFAEAATPYIRPPGATVAQHHGRRRVRTRRLALAVAAVVVILVPVGVVALVRGIGSTSLPVPPATSGPPTSVPATPTATPTVTPTSTAPAGEVQPTPGPGELVNTTLALSWSNAQADEACGGLVTIVDEYADVMVTSTMSLDVDRDGTREIVAQIRCVLGQAGPEKLLVLRPGPSGPTIIGTVLETHWLRDSIDPAPGEPAKISGYAGLEDGTIRVDVADRFVCCGAPSQSAVVQQRAYGWTGSAFAQLAGPTTFIADRTVADLEVTVPTLAFSAPAGGWRTGTLSVRVHNHGPQTAVDVSVYVEHLFMIDRPSGGDWDRCESPENAGTESAICALGSLAPGQDVTLTLPMRRAADQEPGESPALSAYTGRVEVRTGAFRYVPSVQFALSVA